MYRIMQQQLEEQSRIVELTEKYISINKIWASEYENENAVEETLERLGVDYVDLLYIHQLQETGLPDTECLKSVQRGQSKIHWYLEF